MKVTDPVMPAEVRFYEGVSHEAMRAQRQAELQNMAFYNEERRKKFVDWSDPEKRAAMLAQAQVETVAARKMVSEKPKEFAYDFDLMDKKALGEIKPIPPTKPHKLKWYEKIIAWFEML